MKEIDCLGEICPVPILKVQQALKKMKTGDSIKIVTDHSCAVESIKDHLKKTKVTLEIEEVINGVWEIFIVKG